MPALPIRHIEALVALVESQCEPGDAVALSFMSRRHQASQSCRRP